MSSSFLGDVGTNSGSGHRNIPQEPYGRCSRRKIVRMTFRTLNFVAVWLFLASAVLQYNDNDGYLWGTIYLIAFIFCILAELSWQQVRTYIFRLFLCLFAVCTFVGAIYILIARLLLQEDVKDDEIYEFLELLLVAVWMSVVLLLDRYKVVGLFRGYTSLDREHERNKEGHVQMGEVVL